MPAKNEIIWNDIIDDITKIDIDPPSSFMKQGWKIYKDKYKVDGAINGKIFERLIEFLLKKHKITPFYTQAELSFVDSAIYDFILYTEEDGPVSLSAKTTIRERWKQAEYESLVLKFVHNKSKSYLIMADVGEGEGLQRNKEKGFLSGIDSIYICFKPEFDELIENLKQYTCKETEDFPVIKKGHLHK